MGAAAGLTGCGWAFELDGLVKFPHPDGAADRDQIDGILAPGGGSKQPVALRGARVKQRTCTRSCATVTYCARESMVW